MKTVPNQSWRDYGAMVFNLLVLAAMGLHSAAGNWSDAAGVYRTMYRALLCLLCSWTALAQMAPQDPLAAVQQALWKARTEGRFEDAAASREEARGLLDRLPVNAPQYPGWVQGVAQIYQSSGRNVQARAIVQQALDRATSLGESHPARIQLLTMMANYWQQERNLLKSVAYMEKAVAALEAAPPEPPAAPVGQPTHRPIQRPAHWTKQGCDCR